MSLLRWYYRRTILTLRYEGFHILLWRILKMCILPLGYLGFAILYQRNLARPIDEIHADADLVIDQASEKDIDQLAELVAQRYGPSKNLEWYTKLGIRNTILDRIQRGAKCFVGRIGNEIVHYNWIFFKWEESIPRTGRFIHLKGDEALMNDGFTVEVWRGKSVHAAVHSHMLLFLRDGGYRRAYTIASSVKSSRKALKQVVWELSGIMLFFIPSGSEKAWVWRIRGTLEPFVYEEIPT